MQTSINRILKVPDRTFFLFGPRGVGKSTWLRQHFQHATYVDLLDSRLLLELMRDPGRLEAMALANKSSDWVVIDETQKIPGILNEVHRLMETRRLKFALCGSSARKLRRGGVNLLGGRALTRTMEPFSFAETTRAFDLDNTIDWGSLPMVHESPKDASDLLASYVDTYISEEIKEEGVVRSLPPFLRFIGVAGLLNGQIVNGQNIAREAAVPRSTVDVYFSILSDTLLGHFLPAYRPSTKLREVAHPKFHWFDTGVARAAAGLLSDKPDGVWRGFALETLIYKEMRIHNQASGKNRPLCYYRTATGQEVDFVVETAKRQTTSKPRVVCVEVKLSTKWDDKWLRPMRSLIESGAVESDGMYGVYAGTRSYRIGDAEVLPFDKFMTRLHHGQIF